MNSRDATRGTCTCPHRHQPSPPPAHPPTSRARANLLQHLFAKQEKAIRDLTLQVVTVGNRVVAVEGKIAEVRDDIRAISARLAAPAAAETKAA